MVRMHPVLSLVAPVAMIAAESASIVPRTLSVDGVDRFALVHEPGTAAEAGPAPLVLWFHGHGGSATAGVQRHALHRHWPEAVVAYPQGLATPGKTDPAGVKSGWQRFPGDQGDRDLRFADRLVAELSARPGGIDPTRIYACGHSNGGGFTILLWSQRPWFAAVAPASCGGVPGRDAVPVLFIASRQDQVVPFATQERSLDAIARRLQADRTRAVPWPPAATAAGLTAMIAGSATAPLVTVLHEAGHRYPESAPALVVEFLRQHRRAVPASLPAGAATTASR